MAPSASTRSRSSRATGGALLALVAASPVLAGCDSTITQNARAKLAATREISSRTPQLVEQESARVKVEGVTLLRDGKTTAIVVDLRSTATAPLTDVPVTVGVRRRGEEIVFNKAPELGWFQTHVPSIPAGGTVTWVFQSPPGRGSKPGDVPFARAGDPPTPSISSAETLPSISTTWTPAPAAGGSPTVLVRNDSEVPQLNLQVYAVEKRGSRYVSAGTASIEQLAAGASKRVGLRFTNRPGSPTVAAFANPTVFQ